MSNFATVSELPISNLAENYEAPKKLAPIVELYPKSKENVVKADAPRQANLDDLSQEFGRKVVWCAAINKKIIYPNSKDGSELPAHEALAVTTISQNLENFLGRTVTSRNEILIDGTNRGGLPEPLITSLGVEAIAAAGNQPVETEYRGSDMFLG
ncbi:MAG: hypothetical protein ACREGA_01000 [Candidatus Saccharimonadales bacterium]